MNYEKALDEFIRQQADAQRAGSGDDQAYVDAVYDFAKKNRQMLIDFAKFVDMLKRVE